ncbi:MAG: hypothetical protein ACK55I_30905, partial [bacterium]
QYRYGFIKSTHSACFRKSGRYWNFVVAADDSFADFSKDIGRAGGACFGSLHHGIWIHLKHEKHH